MDRREQGMIGAVIYTVIAVAFGLMGALFAWACFTVPLYQVATPFLGAMLFLSLGLASGWAAVYCARLR